MSLSELFSGVLQPLFDLLPQIHARPASNEWGVADPWIGEPRMFTGPYIHIPASTHIEIYTKTEFTIDTGLQSLTTADGKTVSVNATAIIRVVDPLLLRTVSNYHGWAEWCAMHIRACVQDVITGHKWTQSVNQAAEFIEEDSYHPLASAGVELIQLVLEDATECIPIRLLSPYGE